MNIFFSKTYPLYLTINIKKFENQMKDRTVTTQSLFSYWIFQIPCCLDYSPERFLVLSNILTVKLIRIRGNVTRLSSIIFFKYSIIIIFNYFSINFIQHVTSQQTIFILDTSGSFSILNVIQRFDCLIPLSSKTIIENVS